MVNTQIHYYYTKSLISKRKVFTHRLRNEHKKIKENKIENERITCNS